MFGVLVQAAKSLVLPIPVTVPFATGLPTLQVPKTRIASSLKHMALPVVSAASIAFAPVPPKAKDQMRGLLATAPVIVEARTASKKPPLHETLREGVLLTYFRCVITIHSSPLTGVYTDIDHTLFGHMIRGDDSKINRITVTK